MEWDHYRSERKTFPGHSFLSPSWFLDQWSPTCCLGDTMLLTNVFLSIPRLLPQSISSSTQPILALLYFIGWGKYFRTAQETAFREQSFENNAVSHTRILGWNLSTIFILPTLCDWTHSSWQPFCDWCYTLFLFCLRAFVTRNSINNFYYDIRKKIMISGNNMSSKILEENQGVVISLSHRNTFLFLPAPNTVNSPGMELPPNLNKGKISKQTWKVLPGHIRYFVGHGKRSLFSPESGLWNSLVGIFFLILFM